MFTAKSHKNHKTSPMGIRTNSQIRSDKKENKKYNKYSLSPIHAPLADCGSVVQEPVVQVRELCKLMGPLVAKRASLALEKKSFDSKYQLIDLKGVSTTSQSSIDLAIALNESEIKAIRTLARQTIGLAPVDMRLFSTFYYNTTAGGLIASAIALDPSGLSEFTSLAALFDEYKVVSGSYEYDCMSYITNSTTSLNSYGMVAYDPTDGTAPASLLACAQLARHQLYFKTVLITAVTNPLSRKSGQKFDWVVPPGVITSVGSAATAGSSTWQPTVLASPQPYGWLKAYFDALSASVTGLSGLLTYHTKFRYRE